MADRDRIRGDTRARIQEVALELFAEQGYDKTSLREIADRLEVTKAALYYHFKSKEEIVESVVDDLFGEVDELLAWGADQPRTLEMKRELLTRYAEIVGHRLVSLRFLQQNPAGAHSSGIGQRFKERMGGLQGLLVDEDATMPNKVRSLLAVVGMHIAQAAFTDDDAPPDERRQASLDVAMELLTRAQPAQVGAEAPA